MPFKWPEKCYCKVRQLVSLQSAMVSLQSATILLQIAIGITKCDRTLHEWIINLLDCVIIFHGHLDCTKIVIPHQASY